MKNKLLLVRLYTFFLSVGFNPQLFLLAIRGLVPYIKDLIAFIYMFRKSKSKDSLIITPCLSDRYMNAGLSSSIYFIQDLYCSTLIKKINAINHLDIGSRFDGFIAQVASSKKIDVIDIRPSANSPFDNLNFIQGDITQPPKEMINSYHLVSSLHALEHIGLGRYGDRLSINGFKDGLKSCSKLVKEGGYLLISIPTTDKENNIIEFNNQRVFSRNKVISEVLNNLENFRLQKFCIIDNRRVPIAVNSLEESHKLILTFEERGVSIFLLQKI